jgi:hypothetical protein
MKLGNVCIHYGSKMIDVDEACSVSAGMPLDVKAATKERVEQAMYRLCGHFRTCEQQESPGYPQFNLPPSIHFIADGWQVVYK